MTTTASRPASTIFRRPRATEGFWSWITTIDHKKIGIMYGYAAFFFFIVGGLEALLLRLQLAGPNGDFLTAAEYNAMFTTHGVTMIFLFVMPASAAFFNYLLPLMIGARDVAFPRMNALSWWIFIFGGIFLYSVIFFGEVTPPVGIEDGRCRRLRNIDPSDETLLGGLPDGGWFLYQPNAGPEYSPGTAIDFCAAGTSDPRCRLTDLVGQLHRHHLQHARQGDAPVADAGLRVDDARRGVPAPVLAADHRRRAVHGDLRSSRSARCSSRRSVAAIRVLWQHLFWLFGHPEVYILILPAMGIVSEVLPINSRKPLFGYAAVVFAGAAIGFLGFGVWAHHMFASGITPVAQAAFGLATMTIAVPTGIKIFNWMGTMWGGQIRFNTADALRHRLRRDVHDRRAVRASPTRSSPPTGSRPTPTTSSAHFHYVLFGGAIFGLFVGIYYWFPKLTGRLMNEKLGKAHFWIQFIGFNLTFAPMHWLGLQGMVRRTWRYAPETGLEPWNLAVTIGAFIIALGVAVFIVNWI